MTGDPRPDRSGVRRQRAVAGLTVAEGRRVIGTDFLAGTCLRVQHRGYSQTGTFSSTQYWNDNFA